MEGKTLSMSKGVPSLLKEICSLHVIALYFHPLFASHGERKTYESASKLLVWGVFIPTLGHPVSFFSFFP